ncbi:MAG: 16S rRNA (guanine(527)-N(7))-methyltransferase RsmG [Gammaproteobacteria bacterium]|nr:16S rRNA (guanine(527)-N(7))-methyltransferase RsmG [Gammaproteobacteria bacterium]
MTTGAANPTPAAPSERLATGLAELGLPAGAVDLDRLNAYLDMLTRWNRRYRLTARATRNELVVRHVLDSAAVLPFLPSGSKLDAGSGAGLPGLVLALLRPGSAWVLLDSAARKVAFLRHACSELGLANVRVVRERLEGYRPAEPPGAVVARALAPLPKLVRLADHLVHRGSLLVAMLGRHPSVRQLRGLPTVECRSCDPVRVPGLDAQRHVAVFTFAKEARAQGVGN